MDKNEKDILMVAFSPHSPTPTLIWIMTNISSHVYYEYTVLYAFSILILMDVKVSSYPENFSCIKSRV